MLAARTEQASIVLGTDDIRRRIRQIARRISDDYRGHTLNVIGVLEDGFMFMADLVREIEIPVICQFVKPELKQIAQAGGIATQILFSPEVEVENAHVLLVQGMLETGVTTDFLVRHLLTRRATSVKLATLLERPSKRRLSLAPNYFGFKVDERYFFGYGLGAPQLRRNLPYVATSE